MTHKKVILRMPKVLESLGSGAIQILNPKILTHQCVIESTDVLWYLLAS